ncbi:MAG: triose-phosphate isomerase [Thermomonas sp.]
MRPLIAGNWKMNGWTRQLADVQSLADALNVQPASADVLICPPFTLIERAVSAAAGIVAIGGQNCHHEASGAFTGEVSAAMLRDAGASAVIVGHSERRYKNGESNAVVAAKASAALRAGLLAIVCVGETRAQRAAGQALTICGEQIAHSVPDEMSASVGAIGYEPLWAIGSGHTPTAEEITEMHAHIRQCLMAQLGTSGQLIRILYGGSVTSHNAHSILSLPLVGGALVGGASLDSSEFEAIVRAVPS